MHFISYACLKTTKIGPGDVLVFQKKSTLPHLTWCLILSWCCGLCYFVICGLCVASLFFSDIYSIRSYLVYRFGICPKYISLMAICFYFDSFSGWVIMFQTQVSLYSFSSKSMFLVREYPTLSKTCISLTSLVTRKMSSETLSILAKALKNLGLMPKSGENVVSVATCPRSPTLIMRVEVHLTWAVDFFGRLGSSSYKYHRLPPRTVPLFAHFIIASSSRTYPSAAVRGRSDVPVHGATLVDSRRICSSPIR